MTALPGPSIYRDGQLALICLGTSFPCRTPMDTPPRFEHALRIGRSFSELASLSEFIHHVAAVQQLAEEVEYGLQLVAEELFTNMVKYSPEGEPHIQVRIAGNATELSMVFEDKGVRPFDPTVTRPRDFDKPAAERRPGGLGVHLVRTYMDDFRYEHRDGTSTITVVKKLGGRHV